MLRRCRVYPPTPGAAKAAAAAARKIREKEVWKQVDEAMDRMGTVAPGVAARLERGFEWRCQAINSNVSTKNDAASDVGHSAGAAGGGAGGAAGGSGGGSETESEWNATSNVKLCGGVAGEEWREGWSDSSLVSDAPPERDNPPSPLVKENTRGSGLLEDAETAEEGQGARGGRCHAPGGEGGKKEAGAIEDRQMGEAEEAGGGGGGDCKLEEEEEEEEGEEEEEEEEEGGGRRTKDEPEKQEEKEKEKYEKEKEKEQREWGALGPMAFLLRFDGMRYCRGGAGRVGQASATSGAGIPMQVGVGGQEEEVGGGGHAPRGEEEDGAAGLDSALVNALEAAVTGYIYLCSSMILCRCVVS